MQTLAPGLHIHDEPLRFFGVEIGARSTVLETADGVLLHSPLRREAIQQGLSGLRDVAEPRWVVAPNKMHHLFIGEWIEAGAVAVGMGGWLIGDGELAGVTERARQVSQAVGRGPAG